MTHLTKFSVVAATCALLGAAAAQADDQQLTNRLQHEQAQAALRPTTVAVYDGNGAGVAGRDVQGQDATQVIYEFRPSGHGQVIGMYRAVLPN